MVGNSILPKMSGNEWKRGLPDKALKPATLALTASEERFLSHYSEHGDRVAAVRYAGLLDEDAVGDSGEASGARAAGGVSSAAEGKALVLAGQILAKCGLIPLADLATALGADRIQFLRGVWQAFADHEKGQNWRVAATLLAKIHGMWDKQADTGTSTVLVIQSPTCPSCGHEHSAQVDLPFNVPAGEKARLALIQQGFTGNSD